MEGLLSKLIESNDKFSVPIIVDNITLMMIVIPDFENDGIILTLANKTPIVSYVSQGTNKIEYIMKCFERFKMMKICTECEEDEQFYNKLCHKCSLLEFFQTYFTDDCPVCYEKLTIQSTSLKCKHKLCYKCSNKIIKNSSIICPLCRIISPLEYNSLYNSYGIYCDTCNMFNCEC